MTNYQEPISPYKIIKVLFQRKYPGYLYRRELVDDSEYGGNNLEMVNCYAQENGHWISDARMARFLCKKKGLRQIQKSSSGHCVASIGFHEEQQKWYGWSHRTICGFGVGDKIFEERYGDDNTIFVKHGKVTIKTMQDAKKAAKRFSGYVS